MDKFTVVINGNGHLLVDILDSIRCVENYDQVKDVVIFLSNPAPWDMKVLAGTLSEYQKPWFLENYKLEHDMDSLAIMDYCIEFVKNTNWFLSLQAGETISIEELDKIQLHKDVLCCYFDTENKTKIVANKQHFIDFNGNISVPYLDKVQTFANWKEKSICIK